MNDCDAFLSTDEMTNRRCQFCRAILRNHDDGGTVCENPDCDLNNW